MREDANQPLPLPRLKPGGLWVRAALPHPPLHNFEVTYYANTISRADLKGEVWLFCHRGKLPGHVLSVTQRKLWTCHSPVFPPPDFYCDCHTVLARDQIPRLADYGTRIIRERLSSALRCANLS